MKRQLTFEWWNASDTDAEVDVDHYDALQEHANEQIPSLISEGYTSGLLMLEIDDINYQGCWSIETLSGKAS